MTLEDLATDYGANDTWWNNGKNSKLNIFHGENRLLRFHESIDTKARENGTTVGRELGYLGTYYLTTQGIIYSSVLAATENHAIAYGAMVAGSKVALLTYAPVRLLIGGISKAYNGATRKTSSSANQESRYTSQNTTPSTQLPSQKTYRSAADE